MIQSYLRTPPYDLADLAPSGVGIRLVKGGYREPRDVALGDRGEIAEAFERDIETVLRRGIRPAIATHDEHAISQARSIAASAGIEASSFEFQMLYGVRPRLQQSLVDDGYSVRCYVPYGGSWVSWLALSLGGRRRGS